MSRPLSDTYFERLYEQADDPWQLADRWYEARKYAITMALLPSPRYRHAFEPGCSVGVLTDALAGRCDHVSAGDIASRALQATDHRLAASGRRDRVTLLKSSFDAHWPTGPFDLVVLSEICYYFEPAQLRKVLDDGRSCLAEGAHVVAAHWRHPVSDYPITGDQANAVVAATPGWFRLGGYRDEDVVVDVFDTGSGESVAARTAVLC